MAKWDYSAQLYIETCYKCKVRFGIPAALYSVCLERRGEAVLYCPNGHGQVYARQKDIDAQAELRRERDRLKQDAARLEDMIRQERENTEAAKRQATAFKGVATRIKNRVKNGVCPCCNRTFSDLARHMKTKHPDVDNVILLKEAG